MSHFTVMVIGDDVDGQLAPFHEFECTGVNDEFVQDQDITDEILGEMEGENAKSLMDALSYYGLEDRVVDDESKVDTVGDNCKHMYGYAVVKDGKLIKAVNRTNPNAKWDWYQVGGRWGGMLALKPGAEGIDGQRSWMNKDDERSDNRCDSALKCAIDFDAMRDTDGQAAGNKWDKANIILAGRPFKSWDQCKEELKNDDGVIDYDAARREYNGQEVINEFREKFGPFADPDNFAVTREEYVKAARDSAVSTYALLKDGVWYQKGEMGWFGMSSDEMTQAEWNAKVAELIDSLPDDTRITIVDCHI